MITEKDMSGALFRNSKKPKPTSPEWGGFVRMGGKSYRVAGWDKKRPDGSAFVSLAFNVPQPK